VARWEARWFAPGDVDLDLDRFGRRRRRIDSYHVPSLAPDMSLKRRGDSAALEHKRRFDRVELISWCGVDGFAERWVKQRVPRQPRAVSGDWCDIVKDVWVDAGIELARVRIDRECFWTVCVDLACAGEPRRPARALLRELVARAEPSSYPSFLLASRIRPSAASGSAPPRQRGQRRTA